MRCQCCTHLLAASIVSRERPMSRRQDVGIFWAQTSGALSTTILGNGGSPPLALSAVTFFVNFNSGATICHGVPHKTIPVRRFPSITQCLSCPSFCLAQPQEWLCTNCSSFDHDGPNKRFLKSCDLPKETGHRLLILRKPNFSLPIAPLGFLHHRPVSPYFHSSFRLLPF